MINNKNSYTNELVQWFEDGINQNYIRYYEYDEFQNIKRISSGGSGYVDSANWKDSNTVVALKSFKNYRCTIIKDIVNELQLLREVDFHTNIIRFSGITKRKNVDSEYLLILEYADGGTLRNYLNKNFNRLDFNMKLQFAIQITDAVSCLHQRDIIHRDLHPKNILIHQNTIKLADFGRSCRLTELSNSINDIIGVLPYIDPQLHKGHYKENKNSDVYSVGVLLWEISSGKQPFESYDSCQIRALVLEGKRETPIPGTPNDYTKIYTKCWQDNPDDRPDIHQVFSELNELKKVMTSCENVIIEDNIDNDGISSSNSLSSNQQIDVDLYKEESIVEAFQSYKQLMIDENHKNFKIGNMNSLDLIESKMMTEKIVAFPKFKPLIAEIGNLFNEAMEIEQSVEHNNRTCDILLQRIYAVDSAVRYPKLRRNQEHFSEKNYFYLQSLVTIMTKMKKFASDISQMKTLLKYIQAKTIKKTFEELCKEFDSYTRELNFTVMVKNTIRAEDALKADQEELDNYFEEMGAGGKKIETDFKEIRTNVKEFGTCKEFSKEFSSTVLRVNAMNSTMEKFMNEKTTDQEKINNIFQVHPLKFSDYKVTGVRKNRRVAKWANVSDSSQEFAFISISADNLLFVQNQVTILKELHNWRNIIKFYGLTCDGNKWYLVTEWAEYGNLREFYITYKDRFDLGLKLCISLDIARGLNFLRTVEIVHRDIRAENILITLDNTAKLANFKLSRHLNEDTLNQSQNLERARYCAPELLERTPNFKYDHRCEVYSFGILLWEIAEERTPYQVFKDILEITDRVRNQSYRESFSENSQLPQKFQKLVERAVNHDPEFRPKVAMMFNVLRDCFEAFSRSNNSQDQNHTPPSRPTRSFSIDSANLLDFESFNYMTLAEAAKQYRIVDDKIIGDINTAYKCFDAYANFTKNNTNSNKIKAKYYKAIYISRGLVELNMNNEERNKVAASLFKEVADDETNEFPESILRYGICLYNGKGVEQNLSEALKYFEKAAENGFKVAMYNAGNLYYNGGGGVKDKGKAIYYMKLAAYNNFEPAIKFCKGNNIPL